MLYNVRSRILKKTLLSLIGLGAAAGLQLSHPPTAFADSPVIYVAGTLTQSQTWSPNSVYVVYDTTVIPDGITLTVQPGTIIKMSGLDSTIRVFTGGSLEVNGTTSAPIYFTSIRDDSLGGDTNGNGNSTGEIGDYDSAIDPENGSITINHAKFRYGKTEIRDNQFFCGNTGPITILDSTFSNAQVGIRLSCYTSLTLQRNNFSGVSAFVTSNDLTGVAVSGFNANIFSDADAVASLGVSGKIPANKIWDIAPTAARVLKMDGVNIEGIMNVHPGVVLGTGGSSSLGAAIKNGGVLTLGHGVVVKTIWQSSVAFRVYGGGTLQVNGEENDKVIFTSYRDDQAGDIYGIGHTQGSIGDYANAIDMEGGSANIKYGIFKYASQAIVDGLIICERDGNVTVDNSQFTNLQSAFRLMCSNDLQITDTNIDHITNYAIGLNVTRGDLENVSITNSNSGLSVERGKVVFRGSFSNVANKLIYACSWSTNNCAVDASYVEWGNASGPQNKICGQVTSSPWLYNGLSHNENLFVSPNCDGTPTPGEDLANKIAGFSGRTNQYSLDCNNGLEDACQAFDRAFACLSGAMQVAQSMSPWPLPPAGTAQQVGQFGELARIAVSDYMTAQAIVAPAGFGLSFFNQLTGSVEVIIQLASAYNSCA